VNIFLDNHRPPADPSGRLEDLIQSAVVMASFVYFTAMRDEVLPRKPLPIPVEVK
jgi:hypothetical protein